MATYGFPYLDMPIEGGIHEMTLRISPSESSEEWLLCKIAYLGIMSKYKDPLKNVMSIAKFLFIYPLM